jgi:hypothetical protein
VDEEVPPIRRNLHGLDGPARARVAALEVLEQGPLLAGDRRDRDEVAKELDGARTRFGTDHARIIDLGA